MPLPTRLSLLLLISLLPTVSMGKQNCLKQVFGAYCLGGSMSQQLKQMPPDMLPRIYGERTGVIYEKDNERVYVMAYKDVIYKILHTYEPASQATLKDLRRRLQRKYGNYQDKSHYPNNTRNKSRQKSAILRGEGEFKNVWQLPGQSWRVELCWTRKMGISIAYYVSELDIQQKEAARQGL